VNEQAHSIIAEVCEQLIWIVFDNDMDSDVKRKLHGIIQDLKSALT
jgi:hypothetical protein